MFIALLNSKHPERQYPSISNNFQPLSPPHIRKWAPEFLKNLEEIIYVGVIRGAERYFAILATNSTASITIMISLMCCQAVYGLEYSRIVVAVL